MEQNPYLRFDWHIMTEFQNVLHNFKKNGGFEKKKNEHY